MANKKVNNSIIDEGNEFSKLIKLVVIVTIIFLGFYLITFFVNKKDEPLEESKNRIQYDEVLLGNILRQPNKEYYVIVYDEKNNSNVLYETYLEQYKNKKDSLRIYNVNLNNPLNSKFVSETSNFDINDILELKLKDTTLIKIQDEKIVEHFEKDELLNKLKLLTED